MKLDLGRRSANVQVELLFEDVIRGRRSERREQKPKSAPQPEEISSETQLYTGPEGFRRLYRGSSYDVDDYMLFRRRIVGAIPERVSRLSVFQKPAAEGRHRGRAEESFLRWVSKTLIVALVLVFVFGGLVRTFLLSSYYIPSGSMLETLQIDDRIMVNRLVPGIFPLERGDVVVFSDTDGWLDSQQSGGFSVLGWLGSLVGLSSSDAEGLLVKRLIGLPGDHVACCNAEGRMEINGKPLVEPYLRNPDAGASNIPFDVIVPPGRLWVMGDNRLASADSRYHLGGPGGGFVPVSSVVGRAFVVFWPFNHWAFLSNYQDSTFADIPKSASP